MSGIDEILTADQVAELLHMPRSTVEDYARRGVLPSIKLGRHRRFVRSDVADAIELLRRARAPKRNDATERPSERAAAPQSSVRRTTSMRSGPAEARCAVRVVRDTVRVALAAGVVGMIAAAVVVVFGVGAAVRGWYGLAPDRPLRIGCVALWLHNVRALLPVFAAAAAVSWWPRARPALDVVLAAMVGGNVLLVAVALGAYGRPPVGHRARPLPA